MSGDALKDLLNWICGVVLVSPVLRALAPIVIHWRASLSTVGVLWVAELGYALNSSRRGFKVILLLILIAQAIAPIVLGVGFDVYSDDLDRGGPLSGLGVVMLLVLGELLLSMAAVILCLLAVSAVTKTRGIADVARIWRIRKPTLPVARYDPRVLPTAHQAHTTAMGQMQEMQLADQIEVVYNCNRRHQ